MGIAAALAVLDSEVPESRIQVRTLEQLDQEICRFDSLLLPGKFRNLKQVEAQFTKAILAKGLTEYVSEWGITPLIDNPGFWRTNNLSLRYYRVLRDGCESSG